MPKQNYTDEERATLTATELAGLKELEDEPVDATTLDDQLRDDKQLAPEKQPGIPEPGTQAEPAPAPTPAPVEPPASATPSPGDAPPEAVDPAPAAPSQPTTTAPAPVPAPTALPTWTAPADADKQISDLRAQRLEIAQKFDDGDISAAEMSTQHSEIDDKIADIRTQVLKADISTGARLSTWDAHVESFLAKPEHAIYRDNAAMNAALDAEVRRLQAQPDARPLDPGALGQAHQNIQAALGVKTTPAPTPTPAPGAPVIPPTLRTLPASDLTPTNDTGEFAAIDRLTGTAYDDALAKLTPEQMNRYLAQA